MELLFHEALYFFRLSFDRLSHRCWADRGLGRRKLEGKKKQGSSEVIRANRCKQTTTKRSPHSVHTRSQGLIGLLRTCSSAMIVRRYAMIACQLALHDRHTSMFACQMALIGCKTPLLDCKQTLWQRKSLLFTVKAHVLNVNGHCNAWKRHWLVVKPHWFIENWHWVTW